MSSLLSFLLFVALFLVGIVVLGFLVETLGWWLFVVVAFFVVTSFSGDK